MNVITKTVQLPDGRTISIETGKVAKQADGAVVLRMNNTVLLATVTAAKEAVPGTDFMPVTVDYREKYYATGRFPGGFTKRESKASDEEILVSRLVDRALRPLFPSDFHCEVFVQIWLLSSDGKDQPDALAGFAASAAMACFGTSASTLRSMPTRSSSCQTTTTSSVVCRTIPRAAHSMISIPTTSRVSTS